LTPELLENRLTELSERVRKGREACGLTLFQLGERSGVSPSTIQKIEARQMTPSIAVILKIAEGLKIEPGELIAPSGETRLDIIVQREGRHARMVAAPDLTFVKLSADILGSTLDSWRIVLDPGSSMRLTQPHPLEESVFLCECGTIELELDDKVYTLVTGDTLHCRTKALHGIANPGEERASCVITSRAALGVYANVFVGLGED
jgi:transcriptional regulator with XRE-family HTH domain